MSRSVLLLHYSRVGCLRPFSRRSCSLPTPLFGPGWWCPRAGTTIQTLSPPDGVKHPKEEEKDYEDYSIPTGQGVGPRSAQIEDNLRKSRKPTPWPVGGPRERTGGAGRTGEGASPVFS